MTMLDHPPHGTRPDSGLVRDFADGDGDGDATMVGLLGGKGANLSEMTRLGLPVPPGFTVPNDACRAHLTT